MRDRVCCQYRVLLHAVRGKIGGKAMHVYRRVYSVAHILGMSVRTVEMHRANLLGKLGVRSIVEVAGLIPG